MYYLKISEKEGEENDLIYYCRNCGQENRSIIAENVCVSETQLRRSEQKFTHMVNEYTKFDPTLPRINTIKCPNQECSSNTLAGGGGTIKLTPAQKEKMKKRKSLLAAAAASATTTTTTSAAAASATTTTTSAATASATTEEKEEEREVIYLRYDDINMKYIYLCVYCDTIWKTDNQL